MDAKLESKLKEVFEDEWFDLGIEEMHQVTTKTLETIADYIEETEPAATGSISTLREASIEVSSHLQEK